MSVMFTSFFYKDKRYKDSRALFLNLGKFLILRIFFSKTCVPARIWRALPGNTAAKQWAELCLAVVSKCVLAKDFCLSHLWSSKKEAGSRVHCGSPQSEVLKMGPGDFVFDRHRAIYHGEIFSSIFIRTTLTLSYHPSKSHLTAILLLNRADRFQPITPYPLLMPLVPGYLGLAYPVLSKHPVLLTPQTLTHFAIHAVGAPLLFI